MGVIVIGLILGIIMAVFLSIFADCEDICFAIVGLFIILGFFVSFIGGLIIGSYLDADYVLVEERALIQQEDGYYFEEILTDTGTLVCEYEYNTDNGITSDKISLYADEDTEIYRKDVNKNDDVKIEIYNVQYLNNEKVKKWFLCCDRPPEYGKERIIIHYNEDMIRRYESK